MVTSRQAFSFEKKKEKKKINADISRMMIDVTGDKLSLSWTVSSGPLR